MRSQQREHVDLIPGRHTSEHSVPPIHNTKGRQQNNNFVLTSLGGAVSCSGNVLARRSFRFPRALESNGVDCVENIRNTIEDYANPNIKQGIFTTRYVQHGTTERIHILLCGLSETIFPAALNRIPGNTLRRYSGVS